MFINIGLVNGCLAVKAPVSQKMVLVAVAANSVNEEYTYTNKLSEIVGCSRNTTHNALKRLLEGGFLAKNKRGVYTVTVTPNNQGWFNLDHFKRCMGLSLPYNEKLTMIAIAKHMGKGADKCWPKVETISSIVGSSIRTIRRTVKNLIKYGFLDRVKEKGYWFFSPKYDTPKKAESDDLVPDVTDEVPNMSPSKNKYKQEEDKKEHTFGLQTPKLFNSVLAGIGNGMASVRTVIQKMATDKKPKAYKKTAMGLISLWKNTLPLIAMDGIISVKVTNKEAGMLKHFKNFVDEQEGDPIATLEYIMNNWADCSIYLKEAAGLKYIPDVPAIPLINKYSMYLYQCFIDSQVKEEPTKITKDYEDESDNSVSKEDLLKAYGLG